MIYPPFILRVRIRNQQHRSGLWRRLLLTWPLHFGLWLPLFLIWPLLLVLWVILLPLLLIAAVILAYKGWARPLLLGGPALFLLLCALRGLKVEVGQDSGQVLISLQ